MVSKFFRMMRNAFLVIFSFFGIYLSNKSKEEKLDVKVADEDLTANNEFDSDDDGERAAFNLYHFKFKKLEEVKDDKLEEYKDELIKFQEQLPKVPQNEKLHKKIEEELTLIDKRIEQREELEKLEKPIIENKSVTKENKSVLNRKNGEEVLPKCKPVIKIENKTVGPNASENSLIEKKILSEPIKKENEKVSPKEQILTERQPKKSEEPLSVIPILAPIMIPLAVVPAKAKVTKPLPKQTVKPYFSTIKRDNKPVKPVKQPETLKAANFDNKRNLPVKPVVPLKETLMAAKMIDDNIVNNEKILSNEISLKDIGHLLKKPEPALPLLIFRKRRIRKLFTQMKLHNNINSINKKLNGIVKPYKHLSFLTLFSKKRTLAKTKETIIDNLDSLYNLKISLYKNYGDEAHTDEFQDLLKQIESMELDLQNELSKVQKKESPHKVKKKSLFGKHH